MSLVSEVQRRNVIRADAAMAAITNHIGDQA